MTHNIRTLTRCIWVGVRESGTSKDVVEKRSVINLLIAFAYATKNYLREEYSYDSDDIKDLIKHIPKFSTPSSNLPLDTQQNQCPIIISVTVPEEEGRDNQGYENNESGKPGLILVSETFKKKGSFDGSIKESKEQGREQGTFRRHETIRQKSIKQLSFTAHDCVITTLN